MTQLSIFGITPDQSTFQSEKWGTLTFYATKTDKWMDTCRHCLLWQHGDYAKTECNHAPCLAKERTDGKNGYYAIHDYPTLNKNNRITTSHGNN